MKIATWNLERPRTNSARNLKIIEVLKEVNADILVLTESNEIINLGNEYYYCHSLALPQPYYYPGERRTTICSKYKMVKSYSTFRHDTSICYEFVTPEGNLIVYGTVVGNSGNRRKDFLTDLQLQMEDLQNLASHKKIMCYAGDFNISFPDNYYFTKQGREIMETMFSNFDLSIATRQIPQNIDHIVLSDIFLSGKKVIQSVWNLDKKLSDHIGVAIELTN